MDAKYSSINSVESYYFHQLTYKYLFSLSTINEEDGILGLCAINGKNKKVKDDLINFYNAKIGRDITPYAEILTLTEVEEDNLDHHKELLNKLFDKYMN